VCRLLPLCLLHHSPEVRRAAVTSCQAVVAAAPDLMGPLLVGLRHWANHTQEALVLAVSGGQWFLYMSRWWVVNVTCGELWL
jgi:hypothetical protein